jgi:uncharacterized phage-associated protein
MDNQAKEKLFEIYLPMMKSEYLFLKRRPASKQKIDSWREEFMKQDLSTSYREIKTNLVSKLLELDIVRRKMYFSNAEFTEDQIEEYFDKLMKRKIEYLVDQIESISRQIGQYYNYNSGEEDI